MKPVAATIPKHGRNVTVVAAVALLGVALGFYVLRNYAPTESKFYPKCALYQTTGLHCPGCGGTRAMAALTHGRLWEAIRFNPLLILGLPIILGVVLNQRRRERLGAKGSPKMIWCVFAILVCYLIARNVPSPSRSIFAPPIAAEEADAKRSPSSTD